MNPTQWIVGSVGVMVPSTSDLLLNPILIVLNHDFQAIPHRGDY